MKRYNCKNVMITRGDGVVKNTSKNIKQQKPRHGGSNKPKPNVKRLATVIVAGVFVIYFICAMISQQITLSEKNGEIKSLEEKVNIANSETEKLRQELANLEDPEYLERIARERLGLVRPNERIFIDANKSKSNSDD